MNIHNNPVLVEQLAASYALGTLRAAALIWQGRLASMAELQPEVAPSPAVWKRIENLLHAEQQAQAVQAARAEQADRAANAANAAKAVQAPEPGRSWWSSLGLWRGATAAGAFAAVIAVVTGLNTQTQLNGQVAQLSAKLATTPAIQYVAVLADDKAAASILVTFDPNTKKLMLKRVGDFREQPDKSLELWGLPPGAPAKSLGVMSGDTVVQMTATEQEIRDMPALAITLEPKGGVPPGTAATGPILFKGQLLKTAL